MMDAMRKLHLYLLLPVVVIALIVSFLRVGVHNHPDYHDQVQSWLSEALSQDIHFDDFSIVLAGTQLHIDVEGVNFGVGDLTSQRVLFRVNVFSWLANQSTTIDQLHLTDVQLTWVQTADGQWQLQTDSALDSSDAEARTTETHNESHLPSSALTNALQVLGSIEHFSSENSHITLLPMHASPMKLQGVEFHLHKQKNNTWWVTVAGQQENDVPNSPLANLQAQGEITLSDDFALQTVTGAINVKHWPLGAWLPELAQSQISVHQVSGDFWLQHNVVQTTLKSSNANIDGTYKQRPWSWRSGIKLEKNIQGWHWWLGDIEGGLHELDTAISKDTETTNPLLAWPMQQFHGEYRQGQLSLSAQKIDLAAMTNVLTSTKDLPTEVDDIIVGLSPRGYALNSRFYWSQVDNNFLFLADMHQVAVSAWGGVPTVNNANGRISLTDSGGKVTIDNDTSIGVHVPSLTTEGWDFDTMQGQIAWQISTQEVYLDSNVLRISQNGNYADLSISGQFPITSEEKQNINAPETPTQETVQRIITPPNTIDIDEVIKVQVEFEASTYPVKQLKSLLLGTVDLPNWLIALNLTGDIGIIVDVESRSQDASEEPDVRYQYAVNGQNLTGHDDAWKLDIKQASVAYRQQQDTIELLEVNGLVNNETISIHLVDKILDSQLNNNTDDFYWQDLHAHALATSTSWVHFEGALSKTMAATLLDEDKLATSDWLPSQATIEAYIPSCILQTPHACQLAVGKAYFAEKPASWPDMIQHQGELVWAWTASAQQDANAEKAISTAKASPFKLLLSNGKENIYLEGHDQTLQGVGIGLGVPVPRTKTGLVIQGQLPHIDAEQWITSFQPLSNAEVEADITNKLYYDYLLNYEKLSKSSSEFPLPELAQVEIQVEQLHWKERVFNNVDIAYIHDSARLIDANASSELSHNEENWALFIHSQELSAQLISEGNDVPLLLDVDYLRLTSNETTAQSSNTSEGKDIITVDLLQDIDPSFMPDTNISINEIQNNERMYGSWQGKVRNQEGKVFVHDLMADMGHSKLAGNLIWSKNNNIHDTIFSGTISTEAVADALEGWGYAATLDSNNGELDVHLSWPASPLAFNIENSEGDIALRVKDGQLRETPDQLTAAKVITLLDFDKILSVVTLRLSDVAGEGYEFDHIVAAYEIQNGIATTTSPAELFSSSMELSLEGTIDFKKRIVDKELFMTVPLVEKLPLVALLTGSPQLSGLLYVVEKLIGDELDTLTSFSIAITGDLDDPTIELQQVFDKKNKSKDLNERANNVFQLE